MNYLVLGLFTIATLPLSAYAQTVEQTKVIGQLESISVALSIVVTVVFCLWMVRKIKYAITQPLRTSVPGKAVSPPIPSKAHIRAL